MRYCKYENKECEIGPSTTYLETDDDGWPFREISHNGEEYLASNRRYPRGRMYLPEGQFPVEDASSYPVIISISRQEFDDIWQAHLAVHQAEWDATKEKNPIGTRVRGFIAVFFPQGAIIQLDSGALGVASTTVIHALTPTAHLSTRNKVAANVKGYDEENQWLILEILEVHEKCVPPHVYFK